MHCMMSRLFKRGFIAAAFYIAANLAYASDASPSTNSPLSKAHWKIAKTYCPVGCSPEVKAFLKGYAGEVVDISPAQFTAPFIDRCEGEVQVIFKIAPAQAIVDEVNQGIGQGRKMTIKDLAIRKNANTSAIAYCKSGDTNLPIARILSIQPNRILVLFEQQSIVELR